MTSTLDFQIVFHGPFRIGTGRASEGRNESIDTAHPLPASSLKGAMRAAAVQVLCAPPWLVAAVFGGAHRSSPWSWSAGELQGSDTPRPRVRIRIDPGTHTAAEDFIAVADELHPTSATFRLRQRDHIDDEERHAHELLLACAGQAVTALGADRRRGMGWVSVRCVSHRVDADLVRRLKEYGNG